MRFFQKAFLRHPNKLLNLLRCAVHHLALRQQPKCRAARRCVVLHASTRRERAGLSRLPNWVFSDLVRADAESGTCCHACTIQCAGKTYRTDPVRCGPLRALQRPVRDQIDRGKTCTKHRTCRSLSGQSACKFA